MRNLLLLFLFSFSLFAQDEPFNCDYNAYLFQYNDVYAIDLASGNSYVVATDVTPGDINAAAYNPADGYIWGSLKTPAKTIVKIGKNFETTTHYIDELPTSNRYIGDISATGIYYLKGGGKTYYAIDLDPESENYGTHKETKTLAQSLSIHDWAFNAVDNKLYAVEKGTNILYRIDAETGAVSNLGVVPIISGLNYTYGAVYFDASGRFYISANQTGTIYVIQNVQDLTGLNVIESNLFAFGPSSASNDGARCPTAPVPQEICDNGIDDDGDGLIDCEDPSCSGYSGCPVLQVSTGSSSANAGGLESNNRLSQQIGKRNFDRVKSNYKFDKEKAKRFTKSTKYGTSTANKGNGYELTNFIPVGVINEEAVVDSSPYDLVNITNATDVYSVDYIKNDDAVASILLLKTDNNVYEHTKYICDRLLGAQLISVSTIELNGQQFIKALIRNVEGNLEFALSFSAKSTNSNTNFGIESHWNIDKYENNVGYYNFQIWSTSLDDLVNLAQEVLNLLEVQQPITSYNNSTPPTVFVKSGKYQNGKLNLQVVNTNRSEAVTFDGGLRVTETDVVENVTSDISLPTNYISNIEVDAGNLFDIGFRIGDGVQTPDDLFMSDGPWGYDDAASSTTVTSYTVETNNNSFDEETYQVERNIDLEATTSDYIAVFRALTPKFTPLDFSEYGFFKLQAKGTGSMIVRLVKESVSNWQEQYKTTIELTEDLTAYSIPLSEFTSTSGVPFEVNDVTSIVFTMLADNGVEVTKKMTLEQVHFSKNNSLSIEDNEISNGEESIAIPNPMKKQTTIHFTAKTSETVQFLIYNQIGRLVKQFEVDAQHGKNEIILDRDNLSSGMYFYTIKSSEGNFKTTKLLLN